MRLKRIKATGIKGQDFDHELAPVTIVIGPNATGKTARLDAIRLLLMGTLPELGKTTQATMQLASGSAMEVSGQFGTESLHYEGGRQWSVGKVAQATTFGTIPETPAVLMDPTVYLNLTEKERVKYVFGLMDLDGSEWTGEKIINQLSEPGLWDEETEKCNFKQIIDEIDRSDRVRHEAGQSVQEWVEELIEAHKAKLSEANASKQRMEKFGQGMVELKALDTEQTVANRAGELATARQRLAGLMTERGRLAANQSEWLRQTAMVKRLKETIASIPDLGPQLDAAKAKVKELEGQLVPPVNTDRIRVECSGLEPKLFEAKARLNTAIRSLKVLRTEQAETLKNDRCPCCDSKSKSWKQSYEKKMDEKINILLAEQDKANAMVTKYTAELADVNQRLTDCETADVRRRRIEDELVEVKTDAVHRLPARMQDRTNAEKQLAEIQTESFDQSELDKVEREIVSAEVTIRDLDLAQKQAIASIADRKRVEEAKAQFTQAKARAAVLKSILATLQTIQAEMVEWAFAGTLKTANRILAMDGAKPLIKTPLAYHDGELGRFDGPLWISHKTFSGMEKKLVYVALSASLAAKAPIKIVVMDELGVMTRPRRLDFLAQIGRMVDEGTIDQFVGIDADSDLYAEMDLSEKLAIIEIN